MASDERTGHINKQCISDKFKKRDFGGIGTFLGVEFKRLGNDMFLIQKTM